MSPIVILFYNYTYLANPESLRIELLKLCQKLEIKGRIILAHEGINGTLEGDKTKVEQFVDFLTLKDELKSTDFKRSSGTGSSFKRLSVKVRDEIVTTGIKDKDFGPLKGVTGKYISAEELFNWYETGKKFYVVDMRNDFEYDMGRFQNSIFPEGLYHFRDLPNTLKKLEHLKDHTIVTVCTGGIRCEVASGFLMKHGFKDVYQLHNGIHTFMEQFPNKYFDGKLYVFDERMTIGFNIDSPEHVVVGKCKLCGTVSENVVNYNTVEGDRIHAIICDECCEDMKVDLQEGYREKYILKQKNKS
jgi:UPF0176 protein